MSVSSTCALLGVVILLFLLEPLVTYLWDAKGLRRFPAATPLSGITNVGYMIQRARGFRSKEIHELHKKHPILRLGPNWLSFSTPAAIRAIYGHSTPCIKGGQYETGASGPHTNVLDSINKDEHARKRRGLSHAFATRNLVGWEFKVKDKVAKLLRRFDAVCDGGGENNILDFRKWSNLFTIEAIVDIALSHHLGCLEKGSDNVAIESPDPSSVTRQVHYIQSLHDRNRSTSYIIWSPGWYRFWRDLILHYLPPSFVFSVSARHQPSLRAQIKSGFDFATMVRWLVRQRLEKQQMKGVDFDDLVTSLLQNRHGDSRDLPLEEIEAEVGLFLDAGSDTTAIALTHVMYFLVTHPGTFKRLRDEIDAAFNHNSDSSRCSNTSEENVEEAVTAYDRVKSLPYLRAVLDESMRLLPPLATGLTRLTPQGEGADKKGGMEIDGEWIPGGTLVSVPAYTAHRNQAFSLAGDANLKNEDLEMFRPERWLRPTGAIDIKADDEENKRHRDMYESFIPFSAGARGCIGRNITIMEQQMLIASLVRRYDFEFAEEGGRGKYCLTHDEAFLLLPGPMPVRVKRRSY